MPPPDKIRPLVERYCSMRPECEFHSTQEWAWFRHEVETGHAMEPIGEPFTVAPVSSDVLPWSRERSA